MLALVLAAALPLAAAYSPAHIDAVARRDASLAPRGVNYPTECQTPCISWDNVYNACMASSAQCGQICTAENWGGMLNCYNCIGRVEGYTATQLANLTSSVVSLADSCKVLGTPVTGPTELTVAPVSTRPPVPASSAPGPTTTAGVGAGTGAGGVGAGSGGTGSGGTGSGGTGSGGTGAAAGTGSGGTGSGGAGAGAGAGVGGTAGLPSTQNVAPAASSAPAGGSGGGGALPFSAPAGSGGAAGAAATPSASTPPRSGAGALGVSLLAVLAAVVVAAAGCVL
ncbi:hypothetical protein Q8F55_003589 [Vanrija albida]|uniref:Extracellular membrane protein CFEM domain-containing protein n=1 Tax=Vanrija albida TaxID=181172 RepID=A0ABR3Q4M0_9TREE